MITIVAAITTLLANASNSIGEDKFVYGQVLSKISGKNDSNQKVNMTHLEAGFGSMVSKNSQMTLGYRSQKFSNSSSNSSVNLRGYTFGVNHSFN